MKSVDDMKKEAHYLCDLCFLNDVIRGYLVAAMQSAKFGRDDIWKALICLTHEFDELGSDDAEKNYKNFLMESDE